jgi:alpha-N-arabinofuranosidase
VLFRLIGLADHISVHNYFGRPVFADSMAASRVAEQMLAAANAIIDEAMDLPLGVSSRTHRELGAPPAVNRRPGIVFDEWNVWYRAATGEDRHVEEIYNYADALAVASLLHAILRNARTVAMANISMAVNVLGSIFTDASRMVRQTIWYPQKLIRDLHDGGRVLQVVVDGPIFAAKHERFFRGTVDPEKALDEKLPSLLHFTDVDALDAVASVDDAGHTLRLSVVQKLPNRPVRTRLTFRGLDPSGSPARVRRLAGNGDLLAPNTLDVPDRVGIVEETVRIGEDFVFPAASLTTIEMPLQG